MFLVCLETLVGCLNCSKAPAEIIFKIGIQYRIFYYHHELMAKPNSDFRNRVSDLVYFLGQSGETAQNVKKHLK